jgi:hypothetical protein
MLTKDFLEQMMKVTILNQTRGYESFINDSHALYQFQIISKNGVMKRAFFNKYQDINEEVMNTQFLKLDIKTNEGSLNLTYKFVVSE